MKCVPVTQPKTSLETRVASHNRIVIAVAITIGLVVVALAVCVVIVLARKRGWARKIGMFQHPVSRNEMPDWMCGMVIVE